MGNIRGRVLIGNLFGEPDEVVAEEQRKGRSAELNKERNTRILHRFVYYKRDIRLTYEWIVGRIANEFALTEVTVGEIIADNMGELKWIKTGFDIKKVRKEYYWMVWD